MSKPKNRSRARGRASKNYFSATAIKSNRRNDRKRPMRGGYRI